MSAQPCLILCPPEHRGNSAKVARAMAASCLWNKPSLALFHQVDCRKRREFPGSTVAASCGARLAPDFFVAAPEEISVTSLDDSSLIGFGSVVIEQSAETAAGSPQGCP